MAAPTIQAPAPTPDTPPRRRRWISLSLRTFVAITVLSFIISAFWISVTNRRMAAMREIERLGGKVYSLGVDDAYLVDLGGTNANDGTLAQLECLSGLRSLNLAGTQISDAGLASVGKFHRVTNVNLSGTRISDAGLVHLSRLTSVQSLGLAETHVTDIGLRHLTELHNLEWLWVQDTIVTDAGVADLKRALPRLEYIRRNPTSAAEPVM